MGPKNTKHWIELWEQNSFDNDKIENYLDKYRNRFDLFHKDFPFYQSKSVLKDADPKKDYKPLSSLNIECTSGNNPVLFDHSMDIKPFEMKPDEAALYLLLIQNYAVGGGVSKPFNFCHAYPLKGILIWFEGYSLYETLMLNMLKYSSDTQFFNKNDDNNNENFDLEDDKAPWERNTSKEPMKNGNDIDGYVDYLTFQYRRIFLKPEINKDNEIIVNKCFRFQGLNIDDSKLRDPFMNYIQEKKDGLYSPMKIKLNKALWRDLHTILKIQPTIMRQLNSIRERFNKLKDIYNINITGICTEPGKAGKVLYWKHEQRTFPLAYLKDPDLVGELGNFIERAEDIGSILSKNDYKLSAELLKTSSDSNPDKNEISKISKELDSVSIYWSNLEIPFQDYMLKLAKNPNNLEKLAQEWNKIIKNNAIKCFTETTEKLPINAHSLKVINKVLPYFKSVVRNKFNKKED